MMRVSLTVLKRVARRHGVLRWAGGLGVPAARQLAGRQSRRRGKYPLGCRDAAACQPASFRLPFPVPGHTALPVCGSLAGT